MIEQDDFRISRCDELIDIRAEQTVERVYKNPTEIRCFNIEYTGIKDVRFSVKAGLFIYESYPYHVRLLDPIPAKTDGNHTNVQRLTRLRNNRMGIHWREGKKENGYSAMIELSQSRLHPGGAWSNTFCATLDEIYKGARMRNNHQIENFYDQLGVQIGERRDLLVGENPNSPRQHYQCCLFKTEDCTTMDKIVMYSYLLSRIRPTFYGYTTESKFFR